MDKICTLRIVNQSTIPDSIKVRHTNLSRRIKNISFNPQDKFIQNSVRFTHALGANSYRSLAATDTKLPLKKKFRSIQSFGSEATLPKMKNSSVLADNRITSRLIMAHGAYDNIPPSKSKRKLQH